MDVHPNISGSGAVKKKKKKEGNAHTALVADCRLNTGVSMYTAVTDICASLAFLSSLLTEQKRLLEIISSFCSHLLFVTHHAGGLDSLTQAGCVGLAPEHVTGEISGTLGHDESKGVDVFPHTHERQETHPAL